MNHSPIRILATIDSRCLGLSALPVEKNGEVFGLPASNQGEANLPGGLRTMDQEPMSRLIRSLHKLAGPPDSERLRDEHLLERFVNGRDQAAFELLMWRHGPMVLGVCRRVLRVPQDAEDAFQATWLTFVKKAAAIVHREAVGSWLYQVAYRVALRARADRAKRAAREHIDQDRLAVESAVDPRESGELGRVLDAELSRLPARQRAAFVLCCLEGRTGEEAAREMGCPPGTVSSRLTRARERLRRRLTRRGLAPAAAALTSATVGDAWSYPVTSSLADNTLKAALLYSSGATASDVLSAQAVTLAEGVLRAMLVTKLKIAAIIMLTVGVLATAGTLTHHALTAAPPAEEERSPKTAPQAGAAPAPAAAKVPRELLKQRLEAVQAFYNDYRRRLATGLGQPTELFGWSERWLEAELALSDKKVDQVAALKAHVERTREWEQLLLAYEKTGTVRKSDAAVGTYERTDAEIRYFQATGELPPPSPAVKPMPKPGPKKPGEGEGR
jgi:RNA polymerase sigma factor (sigma-70 family)